LEYKKNKQMNKTIHLRGLNGIREMAAGLPSVLYTGFPKMVDMNLNF
tara:strand:+ start:313 stop:453 length:141 start_codon:yes stop_codon:yes gene_type:complete